MKVKKFNNRQQVQYHNSWGDRDGKLYYGTLGEGFSAQPMPEHIAANPAYLGGYRLRYNSIPECDEGLSFQLGLYQNLVPYGHGKGIRNRPFLSTRGSTAGKSFIYVNGGIVSTDATIAYAIAAPNDTAGAYNSDNVAELLFETESHFYLYDKNVQNGSLSYGMSRLMYVAKYSGAKSVQIQSGYFDCVYLGKTRHPTPGKFFHCVAFFTDYITEKYGATNQQYTYSAITQPSYEGGLNSIGHGANLHILRISDDSIVENSFSWILQARKLGSGTFDSSYRYWNRGHKFKILMDESMIIRDDEGFISRFSYLGHISELGTETWISAGKPANYITTEKLQQTFGLNHINFGALKADATAAPEITATYQQIMLPESLLALEWTYNANQSNILHVCSSLMSGRVWRVENKLHAVLTSGMNTLNISDYPVVTLRSDVDGTNTISNPQFDLLPNHLGLEQVEPMLLSKSKKRVWLPGVANTALSKSSVAMIDFTQSPPIVKTHRFFGDEDVAIIGSSAYITALGTRDEELLVAFGTKNQTPMLVSPEDQPANLSLAFDADFYTTNSLANLSVTSDAPCTCTIKLIFGAYEGASEFSVRFEAAGTKTFSITVLGYISAHVVSVE